MALEARISACGKTGLCEQGRTRVRRLKSLADDLEIGPSGRPVVKLSSLCATVSRNAPAGARVT